MRCPACGDKITEDEISQIVDEHTFLKYQQFLFLATLRSEPNCRWCPNPNCSHPVISSPSSLSSVLNCEKCQTVFCRDCRGFWHPDRTCEQNLKEKKKDKSELKSEKKQHKSSKKCPGCGVYIDKFEGCNHITCTYCKFEWCWVCGKEFRPDHYFNTPCKGLQFTKHPHLKRAGQKSLRVGKISLLAVGLGIGGVIALAVAIPVVCVGGPIYGGYKMAKK